MTQVDTPRPEGWQRVAAALAAAGVPHEMRWLQMHARTVQQAADALGVQPAQIAKSIVFRRVADDAVVLVVASGDLRVDEARVSAVTGPLARADAAFVKAGTGFAIGGVSPVGHRADDGRAPVLLLDDTLRRFDAVWAAAGHPQGVVRLTPAALAAATGAPWSDVAQAVTE